ncbi:hypothetical protein HDZ31DRAFT_63603 [Schizophyllum fasciatum]
MAPPDGSRKPRAGPRRRGEYPDVKNTPVQDTAENRPQDLVKRLEQLVGVKICAVTNMMTASWAVHGIHVLTRKFATQHPEVYKCLVEHVGIMDEKGELTIDFDGSGNVELVHFALHLLFDGPSVVGEKYGQGNWAFAPKNWRPILERIKANPYMNYKELFPEATHEYIVYGFPNEHKHVFGRYSDYQRTYRHSRNHTSGPKPTKHEMFAECEAAQFEDPEIHILQTGDQGFVIVSHLNPVFVILDYVFKMKYHIKNFACIPAEDLDFFEQEILPVVNMWFERAPATMEKEDEPQEVSGSSARAAASADVRRATPVTPVQPRLAATAPAELFGSRNLPPVPELSSDDPPEPAEVEAQKERDTFTDNDSTMPPSAFTRRMLDAEGSSEAGEPMSPIDDPPTPGSTDTRADTVSAIEDPSDRSPSPTSPTAPEPVAPLERLSTPRPSTVVRLDTSMGANDDVSDANGGSVKDIEEHSAVNEDTGTAAAVFAADDKASVSEQPPPGDPPKLRRSTRTKQKGRVAVTEQDDRRDPAKAPDKNNASAIASSSTAPTAPARRSRTGRASIKEAGDKRNRTDTADTDDEADDPHETNELPKKKAKMKGKSGANDDPGLSRKGRGAGRSSKKGKKG